MNNAHIENVKSKEFEGTRYNHFQIGNGHATIAYQLDNNRDSQKRKVRFACSFASPKDNFSREKGRLIAEKRLVFFNKGADRKRLLAGELEINLKPMPENGGILFQVLEATRKEAIKMGCERCNWIRTGENAWVNFRLR